MATDDNFQMTQDEMHRMKQALKDKKFVDLLLEYSEEISNPENKKKREEEIIAMEKQRGHDVKLLAPQSGFVVKTVRLSDGLKVFVNICTSPEIQDCSLTVETRNGKHGTHVSMPHSLSPVKEDIDKGGKKCLVYDVCFHPNSYAKSVEDITFRQLLIDTAFDTLEKQTNDKINRKKKRFPKMKYKGIAQTNIIRPIGKEGGLNSLPMKDSINNSMESKLASELDVDDEESNKRNIPEYKIVHRGYFDMQNFTYTSEGQSTVPKELVVEIKLPLVESAAGIDLDIFEKKLILDSEEPPYHLELSLPYEVKEADGQAQFDTAENVLVITLPVVNAERKAICEVTTQQPSVVDVTPSLENKNEINIEHSDNLDPNVDTCSQLTDNGPLNDAVSSQLCNTFPRHDDDVKDDTPEDDTPEDDTPEDDTMQINIDTVRELLKKDFNDTSNDIDVEFDTSNLQCFRRSSKIPPYCYTQTAEKIDLTISIPDVKVIHLSLGFTDQQAYMSYPRNPDDINSPCWEMVIRLEENCFLDKDNCGVDVIDGHMLLILRKREDSLRLWEKFFVGLTESSLQVEFFTTDSIAEDMLKSMNMAGVVDSLVDSPTTGGEEDPAMENQFTNLESRLSVLLQTQDAAFCEQMEDDLPSKRLDQQHSPDHIQQKNSMNFKESNGISGEDDKNTEDKNGGESNISSKLHETTINESEDLSSPDDKVNGNTDSTTDDESPTSYHPPLYGRSFSHDVNSERESSLQSILKHSKSDGEYYCDTEEEEISCSADSFPDSLFKDTSIREPSKPEPPYGRRRIKSVTFNDEPIIFEFAKLSKRQLKKQMKEDRLRQANQRKGSLCGTISKSLTSTVTNGDESQQNGGKSKKKEKFGKKTRSYSDGLLQVPNNILIRHKLLKKKKKNTKNQDAEDNSSNIISATSADPKDKETPLPILSNTLIFELE